jgi:hypothetical protein
MGLAGLMHIAGLMDIAGLMAVARSTYSKQVPRRIEPFGLPREPLNTPSQLASPQRSTRRKRR